MGKYSTKGLHINPKKKKTNKNHKQSYFKKENKKVDKSNLFEIKGNREELAPFVGEEVVVDCFLTNSFKYSNTKRLVSSVKLPFKKENKNLYINHVWTKSEKTKNTLHGFKKVKVKIIEYLNQYDRTKKYGVSILEVLE